MAFRSSRCRRLMDMSSKLLLSHLRVSPGKGMLSAVPQDFNVHLNWLHSSLLRKKVVKMFFTTTRRVMTRHLSERFFFVITIKVTLARSSRGMFSLEKKRLEELIARHGECKRFLPPLMGSAWRCGWFFFFFPAFDFVALSFGKALRHDSPRQAFDFKWRNQVSDRRLVINY